MTLLATTKSLLQQSWCALRELSGDDAYERYLAHHAVTHPEQAPLDRAAFFREEQKRKWDGVRRCC
jgi:uncharacterized short protein YbdD (DUF466 family)